MKRYLIYLALYRRGEHLMKSWMRLVQHFGDGNSNTAERTYPRLISYRKRAMRIARKLRSQTA